MQKTNGVSLTTLTVVAGLYYPIPQGFLLLRKIDMACTIGARTSQFLPSFKPTDFMFPEVKSATTTTTTQEEK